MIDIVRLEDLPPPPPERTGWPWTEASSTVVGNGAPAAIHHSSWPLISIVTPSFNQGAFLEETLRSVLLQGYPRLEYLVLDGGSTDGSRDILERYSPWLDYWRSEPDGGQYAALNEGFARTSGQVMAWINSDDKYAAGALLKVGRIFSRFAEVQWLTSARPVNWNEAGEEVACRRLPGYGREAFWRGEYGIDPRSSVWIQQESTFWRRSLWRQAGGRLDEALELAGDFELWTRFFEHAELHAVDDRLGGFRVHPAQKTASRLPCYIAESRSVFMERGGQLHGGLASRVRKYARSAPAFVRRLLVPGGLAHFAKVVVFDRRADDWRVTRVPV